MDNKPSLLLILILIFIVLLILYYWKRRSFYFHASKIPGPFLLAILGNIPSLIETFKDPNKKLLEVCNTQPPVFKLWLGNFLYIFDSNPEDLKILLSTYPEKPLAYDLLNDVLPNNLLTSSVEIWKNHRKIINQSFNPKLIYSFHDIFVKHSKILVNSLNDSCDREITDLFLRSWYVNVNATYETLTGLDISTIGETPLISSALRTEEIFSERVKKFWLLIDSVWKSSDLYKEQKTIKDNMIQIVEKILTSAKKKMIDNQSDDNLQEKIFLRNLIIFNERNTVFTKEDVINESLLMFAASSETSSAAIETVLVITGLYPEIQEKIYQEICSVLEDEDRDFTEEDMKKLKYLDCVIKETLRLYPTIPIISRYIDKDIELGQYVFPAGSNLFVPISHLHRRSDLWENPTKFDPDRFLPEKVAQRHCCAYIPFSFGSRNCIGFKYAMVAMKINLGYIFKNFTVKALNYEHFEDLRFKYHVIQRPVEYRLMFERRANCVK